MTFLRLSLIAAFVVIAAVSQCDAVKIKTMGPNKKAARDLVEIDGKNYFIDVTRPLSWADAELECNDMNMTLVSLQTTAKSDAILSWINDNPEYMDYTWTSGTNENDEWTWASTNEVFTDTNWRAGEPDVSGSAACANFAATYNGWEDDECDMWIMGWMCEEQM